MTPITLTTIEPAAQGMPYGPPAPRRSAVVTQRRRSGNPARTCDSVRILGGAHYPLFVTPTEDPTVSDADLIAAMARGDERAAAVIYDRHAASMFGVALRIVGESADAEEVVLDAFSQAWREASRYDGSRGSVLGWLTTITRTRSLDLVRARGRRVKATETAGVSLDEPAAMGTGFDAPDVLVDDRERSQAIYGALTQLPAPQRHAIELAFFEGLTHHEVAARLQEPLGTVKTRIRLGMLKLRDTLAALAPERAT